MKTVEEEQKLLYFAWLIQNGIKLGLGDIGLTLEGYFVCEISFAQELSTTAEDALMF
ncbi:unnamed protein product [Musa acuminata subsp. malaccensis]|uniref:(wild Malaysian banana) hypothetical protein n=1 Tax=Musa acuminata subsp. malaccensis TaxID=214687 RepID=A0A804KHC5_MUSAM|nr:unnamed protein product [Musa acuminata subsp. malaccensis]